MICFDYHRNCRGGKLDKLPVLKDKAKPSMNEFGLFFAKGDKIVKYVLVQFLKGYFSSLLYRTEMLLKLTCYWLCVTSTWSTAVKTVMIMMMMLLLLLSAW